MTRPSLQRFTIFTLLTSTAGWDTGRAISNTIAILVLGPAVLATLRRASRKASYGVASTFGIDRVPRVAAPQPAGTSKMISSPSSSHCSPTSTKP